MLVANTSLGIVNSKVVKAHGGSDAAERRQDRQGRVVPQRALGGQRPVRPQVVQHDLAGRDDREPDVLGPEADVPDTVVLRNVPAATQLLDVQRGTNEISVDLSPDQATSLKGNSKVQVAETPSANVFFLFANHNPKVSTTTANTHIQNAIRYGLDYSGLVSLAGAGAVQAAGIVPSMFLGALPASAGAQAAT